MDIASDGLVDWDEFCTYLMLQFEENDQATKVNGNTFVPKPNIVRIDHNKVHKVIMQLLAAASSCQQNSYGKGVKKAGKDQEGGVGLFLV